MNESRDEEPLSGGNTNSGVVKVGDTVRRAIGPQSEHVHDLLLHLERKGFAEAPRFLGIDEQGREILSYIDGESAVPDSIWRDKAALVEATRILRRYHDATEDLPHSTADNWAFAYPVPERREVICHNDFAPYNMRFRGGLPVGIVDFDLAGPGPRMRDIAYLAYWMTPLSFMSHDLTEHSMRDLEDGSLRLKLLCDTYGVTDYEGLLAMVAEVLHHMGDAKSVRAMVGRDAAAKLMEGGHLAHWKCEAAQFRRYHDAILRNFE